MITRILFIFLFLLNIISGYSQNITIKGIALDSTLGKKKVHVSINDTIIKFIKNQLSNSNISPPAKTFDIIATLRKKYTTESNRKGKFKIKSKLTDTLYFSSSRHFTQKYLVSDLLKNKINIQLKPKKCINFIKCNDTIKHIKFIGKIINITYGKNKHYCNTIILGRHYKLIYNIKYKIIKSIYGNFKSDTITISTHIKHQIPLPHETYQYVVKKECHVLNNNPKYSTQITDLYINNEGHWIVPYQSLIYKKLDSSKTTIRPKRINLKKPLKTNINNWNKSRYPEPYYKVKNNELFALFGNTLDEYLELKQNQKASISIEKLIDSLRLNKLKK